jgi:hypothetical protein
MTITAEINDLMRKVTVGAVQESQTTSDQASDPLKFDGAGAPLPEPQPEPAA